MPSGFYMWSETAATNGNADASVNYAEGMPPSAVNDSARAMMAVLRKWGNDISGAIVTAGSSTAYIVASRSGFDTLAHMDGQLIAFTPHATSGATVTLNVDSLGAKPLRSAPGTELAAGVLVQGTPYTAIYSSADSAFYLRGLFGNPYNTPIGGVMLFAAPSAPNSSFVFPYGQAISRTVYSTYFGMVGTTFGAGDGSTTFNLPDIRGRVVAGVDNMGGSAASRLTSSYFGASGALGTVGGAESHLLTTSEVPSHQHDVFLKDSGHAHGYVNASGGVKDGAAASGGSPFAATTNSATTGITIGSVSGTANDNKTAATGGGAAHAIVQPTICLNMILRII